MNDFENTIDRVKNYLRNQMTADEKAAFEEELGDSPELKSIAKDIALLEKTLRIEDVVDKDHMDPDDLISLAEDENSLPESKLAKLREHLRSCDSCRKELSSCRAALNGAQKYRIQRKALTERILAWLFPRYSPSKPVLSFVTLMVVLIPLALLSIPTFILVDGLLLRDTIIVSRLTPVSRSADDTNVISVTDDVDIIRLELDFPYPQDSNLTYNVLITDQSQQLVFELRDLPRQKLFAMEVAAEYFESGLYLITVNELDRDSTRRTITFPLKVERPQ